MYTLPPLLSPSIPSKHEDPKILLSLGPFVSHSQHHLVLDAYALLPKRIRKNFPLVFMGSVINRDVLERIQLYGSDLSIQIETDIRRLPQIISQSVLVFRMGNHNQKNLPIERIVLECERTVLYDQNSDRSSIYPSHLGIKKCSAESLSKKIRELIHAPPMLSSVSNERQKRLFAYESLIKTLNTE
jgi:hypothetical protein